MNITNDGGKLHENEVICFVDLVQLYTKVVPNLLHELVQYSNTSSNRMQNSSLVNLV